MVTKFVWDIIWFDSLLFESIDELDEFELDDDDKLKLFDSFVFGDM